MMYTRPVRAAVAKLFLSGYLTGGDSIMGCGYFFYLFSIALQKITTILLFLIEKWSKKKDCIVKLKYSFFRQDIFVMQIFQNYT